MSNSHRPTWGIILLFILLPLLAFPELFFKQQTLYWTDLTWIHYPRHIFVAEEWLAGRVPLWDPYENTGLPLLAETQVGVLYPFSLIFLSSLDPSLELSLFIMLHFTLAALFTFILARALALSPAAATVTALAYGGGGFLMAQVPNLNIMTGAVWLPLILYGVIETLRRRRWLTAMLAGLPLALQILTAQPQIVFYTLVMVLSYGLYRLAADRRQLASPNPPAGGTADPAEEGPRLTDPFWLPPLGGWGGRERASTGGRWAGQTLALLIVILTTGLLLAAPQLLPTYELQQHSVRSQERGLDFLTENSLRPVMLLNLLLPSAFGNNVTGFKGGDPFQEVFVYIGLLPLLLVGFSAGQPRRREVWFFYGLLGGTLLLALGQYTPLYNLLIQYLPGFSLFRIPSRWLMGVNLALAVLAGFGLETLRQEGLSRRRWLPLAAVCLTLLLVISGAWLFQTAWLAWSETNLSQFHHRLSQTLADRAFRLDGTYRAERLWGGLLGLRVPAILLIVNLGAALSLFGLFALKRLPFNRFAALLILFLSLDLIAAGGTTINPTQPNDWWQQLSGGAAYVLENLENIETERVFPLGMGSEAATVSHLGQYFPSVYRVQSAGGHGSSLMNARYSRFLDEAHPVLAIQLVGVRYLLTLGEMGADVAATYPLVYRDDDSFVYENERPLPRTFIVHDTLQVGDLEEALTLLQTRGFDPAQTVLLETDNAPLPAPATAPSVAVIIAQHPQLVEIEATAAADGYLVLLDTYYPGWIATVDGQPTSIYPAHTIGRAVFVPAGEHTIRFVYRPWSFWGGVGLSLLTLGVLGLVFSFSRLRLSPNG